MVTCSSDHLKLPRCVQMAFRLLLVTFTLAYAATSQAAQTTGEASTTFRQVAGTSLAARGDNHCGEYLVHPIPFR